MVLEENVIELKDIMKSQQEMIASLINIVSVLDKRITNTENSLDALLGVVNKMNSLLTIFGNASLSSMSHRGGGIL